MINFGSPIFSPPYNLQVSNLTHGTHTFRAIATDARGLPSTSPPLTITVSQTTNNPPSVNIVSPTNGQVFSRSPININITATASDQGGITQVVIIGDGIPRCTLPGGQSSYSCQWKRVGAGAHTIVVQASDGTLTGSAQANMTVEGRRTPYDFDQDGISDMTIWRPGDLYWYVNTSSPSDFIRKSFGIENDVLVPADYDGDRKTDFAVWRLKWCRASRRVFGMSKIVSLIPFRRRCGAVPATSLCRPTTTATAKRTSPFGGKERFWFELLPAWGISRFI